jgi:hypothetical protein
VLQQKDERATTPTVVVRHRTCIGGRKNLFEKPPLLAHPARALMVASVEDVADFSAIISSSAGAF